MTSSLEEKGALGISIRLLGQSYVVRALCEGISFAPFPLLMPSSMPCLDNRAHPGRTTESTDIIIVARRLGSIELRWLY